MKRIALLLTGAALMIAPCDQVLADTPTATAAQPPHTHFGDWGVDLATRDLSVKPGDDFQRYASGLWLDKTEIPADRASTGTFYNLREAVTAQVQSLIISAPSNSKYGLLYTSFMNERRVEALGIKPLTAGLARLRAINNKTAFARFMGTIQGRFGTALVAMDIEADTADPTLNVLFVDQDGLGMPDREYYLNPQFDKNRTAYKAYLARTLKVLGYGNPRAATAVYAFEEAIARVSWKSEDTRDIGKINNPYSTAQLAAYAPGLDWAAFLAGAGIGDQSRMIVGENTAIRDIAAIFAHTPLSTLKLWEAFHIADQASPYLGDTMVKSRFAYTRTLTGVTTIRPRWKRAIDLVNSSLGEMVGEAYVARYFPASSKAKMEQLVANLKAAMAARIDANTWMSPQTRQAARVKLASMDVMVGYPDHWRDYSALVITADDLYGNAQRAGKFDWDYRIAHLGQKVDRQLWRMVPQTVNAYNGFTQNKIVFPAGILQAPFFDPSADDAVNYGAIGAVIGHEISHGFDDQGRKIDETGKVRDWWTAEDAKRFEAESKVFGDQYARYEAAPGSFVNPRLTMGKTLPTSPASRSRWMPIIDRWGTSRRRCSTA
jgi:putative endopeptidase